jgi:hypothetical protein
LSARTERTGPKRSTVAHEFVDLFQLFVGEAEIGFADRRQAAHPVSVLAPHTECIVRIETRSLSVAALGVHQNRIDQPGIALPFEPGAFGPPGFIDGIPAFQHQAFGNDGIAVGRIGAQLPQFFPTGKGLQW